MDTKVKKLEKSQVEIITEIPWEKLETYRKDALKKLGESVSIDGFRKGKVPEDILVKNVGEMAILEEMAQTAISKAYPEIIKEHKIDAIGQPQISVTKLAKNNPLGFTAITAVVPEIKLADYKSIAKKEGGKKEESEVTEKEVDDAIKQLQKMRAQTPPEEGDEKGEKEEDDKEKETPSNGAKETASAVGRTESASGETKSAKDSSPLRQSDSEASEPKEEKLPEVNDEFVKTLGDFKDVADFKKKLKDNMAKEKELQGKEKKRIGIIESIIKETKMDVPQMLIDYEVEKMLAQMQYDIEMSGMKFDEYLEKIGKTKEDMRKEWAEQADKRARMQLIVNKIADEEKIEPTEKELDEELKKLEEHYKQVAQDKPFDKNHARNYVASVLTNQKVFEFLEKQGEGK